MVLHVIKYRCHCPKQILTRNPIQCQCPRHGPTRKSQIDANVPDMVLHKMTYQNPISGHMYPNYSYGSYETFQTLPHYRNFLRLLISNSNSHSSQFINIKAIIIQLKHVYLYIDLPHMKMNRNKWLFNGFRLSPI
ncbi:Sorting nexin-25 [Gossypium arboreum]|uniref:Sorting nexin-25 n=1 Tax=Gossypium arboreum TaxID=29729 RepID=A0A0B0NDQ5_GOSAR|nr:Sorting nexin-25 [Gossypium arboreum]